MLLTCTSCRGMCRPSPPPPLNSCRDMTLACCPDGPASSLDLPRHATDSANHRCGVPPASGPLSFGWEDVGKRTVLSADADWNWKGRQACVGKLAGPGTSAVKAIGRSTRRLPPKALGNPRLKPTRGRRPCTGRTRWSDGHPLIAGLSCCCFLPWLPCHTGRHL